MASNVSISCQFGSTVPAAKLGLEVWLDQDKVLDCDHVCFRSVPWTLEFADTEAEHELRFIMKNKITEHTQINEAGVIVSDARLTISDLIFDDIKLGQIFVEQAVYTHNFNGTGNTRQNKFYGEMGCNGTVSLKFSTPMYLWLLENI